MARPDPSATTAGANPQPTCHVEPAAGEACPWPSFPPPKPVRLYLAPAQPCPYKPERLASNRVLWTDRVGPEVYHGFMNANFRRSGKLLYQPICTGCRACQQIRVPIATFRPSKSQRRCWRRNADLRVSRQAPVLTDEKFELHGRYVSRRHGRDEPDSPAALAAFLYDSPVETVEYLYRDPAGKLVGVGICDVSRQSLSTVYFFHDPDESARGPGTFSALYEIEQARQLGIPYYYLGFWIDQCPTMHYKANFRPNETLCPDGVWRPASQ